MKLKKFVLYALTYILVTFAAAFGTITMNRFLQHSNNAGNVSNSNQQQNGEKQSTDGEKLLNSLITMGGTSVNLDFYIYDNQISTKATSTESVSTLTPKAKVNFVGELEIPDLENIKLRGDVSVKMQDTSIDINIAYLDNVIYISNQTMSIKLESASISKIVELLPALGLNINLGDSLAELDTSAILNNFQNMKAEVLESGDLVLPLKLTDSIALDIITDANYFIKTVQANRIEIKDMVASVTANLTKDETIAIENPEQEKEYVDVTKTLNIVDSVKEILTNKKLHLNMNANLVGQTSIGMNGAIDVDYNSETNIFASFDINLDGTMQKVTVGYIDNDLFISINDLKFMVDKSSLQSTIDVISNYFDIEQAGQNMLVAIAKIIPGFELSKILDGDFSNININNLLEFAKGEDNVISITVFGRALGISTDINLTISLDENDQFSSLTVENIKILDFMFNAKMSYSNQVNLPVLQKADYVNLQDLSGLTNAILNTAKQISTNKAVNVDLSAVVDLNNKPVTANGSLTIDFENKDQVKTYLTLNATVFNKTINLKIAVINKELYIFVDNLKFKTSFDGIANILSSISPVLKDQTTIELISTAVDMLKNSSAVANFALGNISKLPQNLIKAISSTEGEFGIKLNKDALNIEKDIDLKINYDQDITNIIIANIKQENVSASIELNVTDTKFEIDYTNQSLVSLENVDELISAVLATKDKILVQKLFATSINATLVKDNTTVKFSGNLAINNGILYANLNVKINDKNLPVEMYVANATLYINVDGLKIKLPTSKLKDLSGLFGNVDINKILTDIVPSFNFAQIKDYDWSSINLDIIKSIEITSNQASVTLNKNIVSSAEDVKVTITFSTDISSIALTGVNFKGYQLNATINTIDVLGIPEISADYADLSNIAEFAQATKTTVEGLLNKKQVALNVNANLKLGSQNCSILGKVFVNYANIQSISNLSDIEIYAQVKLILGTSYDLTLRIKNGYAYADYQNLKLKIELSSAKKLIETISNMLPANDFDINSLIANSVLEDLLNKDFSTVSLNLIKSISLNQSTAKLVVAKELLSTEQDIELIVTYQNEINAIELTGISLKDIVLNGSFAIDYDFEPEQFETEDYQNITGIENFVTSAKSTIDNILSTKEVALSLSNTSIKLDDTKLNVSGTIYINFKNAIKQIDGKNQFDIKGLKLYANIRAIDQTNYTHKIELQFAGDTIYLTYNNLNLSLDSTNLESIIVLIEQFKFISENLKTQDITNVKMRELVDKAKQQAEQQTKEIDLVSTIKSILPGIDIDAILNKDFSKLDLSILSHLSINENTLRILLAKQLFDSSTDAEININFGETITGARFDGLEVKGISVCGDVALLSSFEMPAIGDTSIYISLNKLESAVNSALNTAIEVVDNKHISFGLETEFTYTTIKTDTNENPVQSTKTVITLLPSSHAKFDWHNAYTMVDGKNNFDFTKMSAFVKLEVKTTTNKYQYTNGAKNTTASSSVTNNHIIEVTYIGNIVYIRYNNMYAKIGGGNIKQIVTTLCEIAGIEADSSMIDNIKNMLGNKLDMSMFANLKVEMIKSIDLTDSHFGIIADLSSLNLGIDAFNELKLDVDYTAESLQTLVIKDLSFKNIHADKVKIGLNEFTAIEQAPEADYIDLSNIDSLLEAVKNSKDFKDFEIDGNVKLKINVIGINIDWDIPVSVKIKLLQNNKFEASIKIGPIPVVPGVNDDVPFKVGNVTSGIYAGLNRILTLNIKDDMVYIYRSETVPTTVFQKDRTYEKKMKVHINTLLDEPLYYLMQYGFGFSDSIMTEINNSINQERQNPLDYSNILKGFSATENFYALTLNLKELAENDKLDTMTLGIRTSTYNGNKIISGLTVDLFMPVASSVEITIKSDNINLVNIGGTANMSEMYDFVNNNKGLQEGASWDAYDGDWKLSSQREFTLHFETNCDQTIADVKGIAGSEFILPVLDNYYVDTAEKRTYYTFAGWYTTKNCVAGSEYTENVMSRKDTTLYAKWNVASKNYVTINFETNGGEAKQSITMLEGETFELPTYLEMLIVVENNTTYTKQFDGWYLDSEFTQLFNSNIMPGQDTTLFAKWSIVDSASSYQLDIFDIDEKVFSRMVLQGKSIELSGSKFNQTTLYYLDKDYSNQIDISTFEMPEHDVVIYVRNKYTATILSAFGSVLNYTVSLYQGETISLPNQASYQFDTTANGQLDKRYIYTFNGYLVGENLTNDLTVTMPNRDEQITASWTEQIKNYYTITFNTKTTGLESTADKAVTVYESVVVLEGTTFDLSSYRPTCVYKWGIWYHCTFKGWKVNDSQVTSFVVTGNTTVEAKWSTPKSGKG